MSIKKQPHSLVTKVIAKTMTTSSYQCTLDELQTFITIINMGSITKASELTGQTLSALSRTLSRLEKKLDTTLLRRTTRRQDITQEGEIFYEHANHILQSLELAENSVKDKNKAPSGLLKIDSASPFILHAIVPFMEEFKQMYPLIRFELHSSERFIDLLEKQIDVAIRIGKLEDSSLHATSLGSSRLRILASPEYLKKYGTPKTLAELNHHSLLGFTAPRELNLWPLKNELGLFYPEKLGVVVSSGETLLHLAKHGVGIVCLSDFMTKTDRDSGALIPILKNLTLETKQDIHAVYYKSGELSQRANLFVQFLKKKLNPIN